MDAIRGAIKDEIQNLEARIGFLKEKLQEFEKPFSGVLLDRGSVLKFIHKNGEVTVADIRREFSAGSDVTSKIVKELIQAKLARDATPDKGRYKRYELTAKGRKFISVDEPKVKEPKQTLSKPKKKTKPKNDQVSKAIKSLRDGMPKGDHTKAKRSYTRQIGDDTIIRFLKTHERFTAEDAAKELGMKTPNVFQNRIKNPKWSSYIQVDFNPDGVQRSKGMKKMFRSTIYEGRRETVAHAGEGVREGRRLGPIDHVA